MPYVHEEAQNGTTNPLLQKAVQDSVIYEDVKQLPHVY